MPYSAKASRALARESGRWLAVFAILGLAGSASASAVFRYTHFEHKCVNGFNIVKHASKTVAECAVLCDANPGCYGFEYGVDHGEASTTYSPEDCQLSSSADTTGCTGYNLDFYAKGESMLGEHHHLPECGSPGAGAQCACPPGTLGPLGGGDGAGGPCAPAECGSGRSLSNRTWSSVFNGVCGAATASVVDNYGVECWDQCGGVQGPCSFCGIGYCCRNDAFWDDTSNGCDGSTGIPGRWGHVCALPPHDSSESDAIEVYLGSEESYVDGVQRPWPSGIFAFNNSHFNLARACTGDEVPPEAFNSANEVVLRSQGRRIHRCPVATSVMYNYNGVRREPERAIDVRAAFAEPLSSCDWWQRPRLDMRMCTWQGEIASAWWGSPDTQSGTWMPGETQQWLRIDLQASESVAVIRVWASIQSDAVYAMQRMNGATVEVGDSDLVGNNRVCATIAGMVYTYVDVQCPPGTMGRYVIVAQAAGFTDYFEIGEVEVFGKYFNLARACSTPDMACETFGNTMPVSGASGAVRGNDGNYDTLIHSDVVDFPAGDGAHWWRVDLETIQDIAVVRVHNRRDYWQRIDDFGVSVGDSPSFTESTHCAAFLSPPPNRGVFRPTYVDVPCPLNGRYVFVFLPRVEWFNLAEIEVFGVGYAPTVYPSKRAEACARACLAGPDRFKRGFSVKENSDSGACRCESGFSSNCTRTEDDSWTRYDFLDPNTAQVVPLSQDGYCGPLAGNVRCHEQDEFSNPLFCNSETQTCGTSEASRTAQADTVYDSQEQPPYVETCGSCPRNEMPVPGATGGCSCSVGFRSIETHQDALGVENYGMDCWSQCGETQGPCSSFCGTGYCCRYLWEDTSNGCDGSIGIVGVPMHVCSYPPPPPKCESCDPGKFSASIGNGLCTSCAAGKYSPGLRSSACLDCVPGKYSTAVGAISNHTCLHCIAGKYSSQGGADEAVDCRECAPGKFSSKKGSTACLSCAVGKYSSAGGNMDCDLCPSGKFSNLAGLSVCADCADFSITASGTNGSLSKTSCVCMRGYEGPDGGPCLPCGAGKYKEEAGSGACDQCGEGSDSPAGSSSLSACACNAGFIGPDGGPCVAQGTCEEGKLLSFDQVGVCLEACSHEAVQQEMKRDGFFSWEEASVQDSETCSYRVANFYFKFSGKYGCRNLWGPSYLCARSEGKKFDL